MAEAKTDSGYTPGSYNPDYVGSSGLTNQQVIDNFRAAMAKSRSTPASSTVNTGGGGGGMMSSQSTGGGFSGQPTTLQGAYGTFLGRAPDPEGLSYWKGQVESGNLSLSQAINAIGKSPEASTFQAGGGISGSIGDVYTGYLGREADPKGLEYWTGQIGSGMLTPEQVRQDIITSEEALDIQYDDPIQQAIGDLYNEAFGRAPKMGEGGGLEFWAGEVRQAAGEQPTLESVQEAFRGVAGSIYNSPEYIQNQVSGLYSNIFDNNIDPAQAEQLTQEIQQKLESGVDLNTALTETATQFQGIKDFQNLQGQIQSEDPNESMYALRNLMYGAYTSGEKLGPNYIESLLGAENQEASGTLDDPYTRSAVAWINAKGLNEFNKAVEAGDEETAARLAEELQDPMAYYEANKGPDPWNEIRDTVVGADSFYGRGDPRNDGLTSKIVDDIIGLDDSGGILGSGKAFLENPIEALDRWKDKPFTQFVVSAVNPAAGALLSATSTLDRGGELSPLQIVSLAVNAGGIAELGQAGFTAAGGGQFGAGFLTEQSIMNAAQNLGVTAPDALQGIVQAGEKLNQAYNVIAEPVTAVANSVIDRLGGKGALIAAAGEGAATEIEQGLRSGATAAVIAEATGKNPAIAFLKELKGEIQIDGTMPDFIPEMPQSVKDFIAGVGDTLSDIPTPDLAFVEDWVRDNVTLNVDTDVFNDLQGMGFTDELASIEDWLRENVDLSGVEDFLRESGDAVGDTVEEIVEAIPEIPKPERPELPPIVPREELMADSAYFNRLFQPGLPVDTSFLVEEPSLAQQLLVDRTG